MASRARHAVLLAEDTLKVGAEQLPHDPVTYTAATITDELAVAADNKRASSEVQASSDCTRPAHELFSAQSA